MPKPSRFSYEKKAPFRDASLFVIVCEGQNREVDYFRFFDGMSSRLKIVPVSNADGRSAPERLIPCAIEAEREYGFVPDTDRLWFVIDTDRWREALHLIRAEAAQHTYWQIAQSNPCFEVWLWFHATSRLPELDDPGQCKSWKALLNTRIRGGFSSDTHPVAIGTAVQNARTTYQSQGYFPKPGSTQVWQLAEELLVLIGKDLRTIEDRFPAPEAIE